MRKLLNMLKKDDNTLSIGRLCAVLAFILFSVISLYLAFFVKTWGNYEAFAAFPAIFFAAIEADALFAEMPFATPAAR